MLEIQKNINKFEALKNNKVSDIPTFEITVLPSDIAKLNKNLPESGKEQYIPIKLKISNSIDDNKYKKVKMRYRGDGNYHWFYDKKSLRIKLPEFESFDSANKFNLINMPHLPSVNDVSNYDISNDFDILSPNYYPVNVYINKEFMGVYMYLEQIDESFLRKNKKMPGSIYYGDSGKAGEDGISTLWTDASNWEKKTSRNKDYENDRKDIDYFIENLNTLEGKDFYNFFTTYIDYEKYISFFMLDTITGSYHHDLTHNHKIYFDPYRGKFEPIQWDLRFWTNREEKNVPYYIILKKMALIPQLEEIKDIKSFKFYSDSTDDYMVKKLHDSSNSMLDSFISDPYKDEGRRIQYLSKKTISTPIINNFKLKLHTNNADDALTKRKKTVLNLLDNANTVVKSINKNNNYLSVTFISSKNSPVVINNFTDVFEKIFSDNNLNSTLDIDDKTVTKSIKIYPGRKIHKETPENLDKYAYGDEILKPAPLEYTFFIKDNLTIEEIKEKLKELDITNSITGSPVELDFDYNPEKFTDKADSIHPWLIPTPEEKEITLSGIQIISETIEYDKYTNVKILPGTIFYLDPEKSIYFYGKVTAIGTKDSPIKFIKSSDDPWGIVALQGQDTSGSVLSYIEVVGGSIDFHNLINYTSQLSIHDSSNIELSNCDIGQNYIGDDAAHFAYIDDLKINNCVFHDARSDAVDIDISKAVISNNVFINSGNDLLDLMTTEADIKNNMFINGGDKGISVGEESEANLYNNLFYQNQIGIEVKDKSEVNLLGKNILIDSEIVHINLYNKNDLYNEGGKITGEKIYFIGDSEELTKDKRSKNKINKIIKNYPDQDDFQFIKDKLDIDNKWKNLPDTFDQYIESYNIHE